MSLNTEIKAEVEKQKKQKNKNKGQKIGRKGGIALNPNKKVMSKTESTFILLTQGMWIMLRKQ